MARKGALERYENSLGLDHPLGRGFCEFIVVGKDENNVELESLRVLSKHRVRVKWQIGRVDEENREFILDVGCDIAKIDCATDDLLIELRRLRSVKVAERSGLKNRIFPTYLFPLTLMKKFRMVLMRADTVIELEKMVRAAAGEATSSSVFFEAGRSYARDLASHIREISLKEVEDKGEGSSNEFLLENLKDCLKISGFGMLDIRKEGESIIVKILDPISFSSSSPPSSSSASVSELAIDGNDSGSFIRGMIAGILEETTGNALKIIFEKQEANGVLALTLLRRQEADRLGLEERQVEGQKEEEVNSREVDKAPVGQIVPLQQQPEETQTQVQQSQPKVEPEARLEQQKDTETKENQPVQIPASSEIEQINSKKNDDKAKQQEEERKQQEEEDKKVEGLTEAIEAVGAVSTILEEAAKPMASVTKLKAETVAEEVQVRPTRPNKKAISWDDDEESAFQQNLVNSL